MTEPQAQAGRGFGKTAESLSKNPLGIIALFIVLVYAFAALVTTFASSLTPDERLPLVWFLIVFPVLVLIVFTWLVSKHNSRLYAPQDFKDESNWVRMQLQATASLTAAVVSAHDSGSDSADKLSNPRSGRSEVDLREIVQTVDSFTAFTGAPTRVAKVLWVDDNPANQSYERAALEAMNIVFTLASSTDSALPLIDRNEYDAIISDMNRIEGNHEGYILLETVRARGMQCPFFFYTGSASLSERREATVRGAQGRTNLVQELFSMVLNVTLLATSRTPARSSA